MSISARTRTAGPAVSPGSRVLPAIILVLALAGLAIAADLWILWHRARAGGGAAFCDVSDWMSCSKVATSRYATVLGVPLAAWGALAYLLVAGLALWALARRPHRTFPGGLLLAVAGFMSAGAAVLAFISEIVIGAFCIMCMGSWTASLALLAIAVALVRRGGGPGAALRADLGALRARPALALGGAAILAAAGVGLLALYAAAPWRTGPSPAIAGAGPLIPPGPPGSLPVYEFSDYMCPHCALLHAAEPAIIAQRPDVRFVRRFFPLDPSCNGQLVTRALPGHEYSCELARGGICAEAQGRFQAYDDAAFAAQDQRPTAEKVAAQVGLDLPAFRDCLASPQTEQRLADDVAAGNLARIRGTPTLQIRGKTYGVDLLPLVLGVKPLL